MHARPKHLVLNGTLVPCSRPAVVCTTQHRLRTVAKAAADPIDIEAIYTSTEEIVQSYIGPVKAVRLKVGLGIEASKTLKAGETLLISTPLALSSHTAEEVADAAEAAAAEGADDESGFSEGGAEYEPTDADIDTLADQLSRSQNPRVQAWLAFLDDGNLDATKAAQLPDLQALAAQASSSSSTSAAGVAGPAPGEGAAVPAASTSSSSSSPIDEDTLLDITDLNVRVLLEDEALLGLQSSSRSSSDGGSEAQQLQEPKTLVGIWPELTLLQHSCSPNTSVVAHKSAAVITASRNIPKQGGLSQNLLGSQLLAPLAERRAVLQQVTGVKCMCLRCRDEERVDRNLQQLVADIYEACTQQIGPELEAAVEADDEAAIESLKDQLAAYCEVLDAGFSKLAVKQQTQIWLQASLFKLYEYAFIAAAACVVVDARLLELLAALAGEVSPGSNEHIFWARQYRDEIASDEESYFDGALMQADKMLYGAYQARYGRGLSRALYRQMEEQQLRSMQAIQEGDIEVEFY